MIKIAIAQINTCVGDLKGNTLKVIESIKRARQRNVDLVIFPELTLSGYPPEDLLLKPHFITRTLEALEAIKRTSKEIAVLVGFIDRDYKGLYNACALIENAYVKDVYRKVSLPNYGVFDEKRYFRPGESLSLCSYKGYKFALSICEDLWRDRFIESLKHKDLDFVINIAASPFHIGKISQRKDILASAAQKLETSVIYCNLIGGQDELVFDGTSMVLTQEGSVVHRAKRFAEDFLIIDFDRKQKYPSCDLSMHEEEEAFGALTLGLTDYVRKNGFNKVVVGVSGGIDSGLVLALSVHALGGDQVTGLLMPSKFSSRATFTDAKKICANLGVRCEIINIDTLFNEYLTVLGPVFGRSKPDKTEENIQARIRGNLLMAYSNKFSSLVLNTGNKSEVSCGYCTLYGDMVGGFGLLKDVPKMLVYKLSRYVNKIMNNPIPASMIKRAPTAELKYNQKDQDTLPAYGILDSILRLYVEEDRSFQDIVKKGFDARTVKQVIAMVDASEYKRRQAPIGIKISPRAFGKDRRMPITNKFDS